MSVHPADLERQRLRAEMRARRQAVPPRERMRAAEAVARVVRALADLHEAHYVAGYWAVGGELPLHALFAPRPDFTYMLPCLGEDGRLRFAPWEPGEPLRTNRYSIPEPEVDLEFRMTGDALDIVLVPLLAFDERGHRIGSGAGWYDRSFAFVQQQPRPDRPILVGVGYAFQEVERVQNAAWDVPLDWIVTDTGLQRGGG